MRFTLPLLVIFLSISCSNQSRSDIVHPTDENLIQSGNYHFNVLTSEGEPDDTRFGSAEISSLNILDELESTTTFGVNYGDVNQAFGRIEDIAIDSTDRIYILDSQRQVIRVFNVKGEYLTKLGGRGRGPGELLTARSMAVYENDFLLVNNGYQIVVYDITSEPIEYLKTITLEKFVHSICVIENELFLHSPNPLNPIDTSEGKNYSNMIHSYTLPSFEFQFSFGQSYKGSIPFIAERMSVGNLSCNEVTSTVLFTFERMQVIHGYSANDGELLWKNRVDGLNLAVMTEINEGGRPTLRYQMPDNNLIDHISSTQSLYTDSKYELFQVVRADVPETGNFLADRSSKVYSFLVDSTTGDGIYLGTQIPEIKFMADKRIASVDFFDGYSSVNLTELDGGYK